MLLADRVNLFTESVIRGTTRHAMQFGAVNLAQGMPDFDPPASLIEAAQKALAEGFNQYAITWGAPPLRQAIASKARLFNKIEWADPDQHVTVTCGSTEAMMAAMLALINPGDEVIIFQPWYENYGPDTKVAQAKPVYVTLQAPTWSFDPEELRKAFGPRTKAIIVNTPHNPTGKVFTRPELQQIADLCIEHGVWAITDEIYEHILYDGREHISIATLPGMAERTITISGLSKTFSITGWRLGYTVAPAAITAGIRRVHDFLTVGAPHPLQMAAVAALNLPADYYAYLTQSYTERRDFFAGALRDVGFEFGEIQGAYYIVTDITPFEGARGKDDTSFVKHLIEHVGVAAVPASSFYIPGTPGATRKIRFMFAKSLHLLEEAARRLQKLKS